MSRRTPLRALIVFELDRNRLVTAEEIQSAVTMARIREGLSWHVFKLALRLLLRGPETAWRLFKPVPIERIQAVLDTLVAARIVRYYEDANAYALTIDEGYRSLNFWMSRKKSGAYG